jgi:hypothetical protein
MLVKVAPSGTVQTLKTTREGVGINRETLVRSKILSHFIKEKISLSPMETILMIPGKLEHLENLVKLARYKKNSKTTDNQVFMILTSPTISRIFINRHIGARLSIFL